MIAVTGAVSGIDLALSTGLLALGAQVVVLYNNAQKLTERQAGVGVISCPPQ